MRYLPKALMMVACSVLVGAADAVTEDVYTTPAPFTWVPGRPSPEQMECLKPAKDGCESVLDMHTCLHSKDGSGVPKDANGFYIHDEPCVWCGGPHCRADSTNVCEPYDLIVHGKGTSFAAYNEKANLMAAHCNLHLSPPVSDRECLEWNRLGCTGIQDRKMCLESRDGRSLAKVDGFNVGGEPCVWCGGGPCTEKDDSLCAPYDWLMNGEGIAFEVLIAKNTYRVSSCRNGKVQDVRPWYAPASDPELQEVPTLTPVPWWRPPHPTPEESSCLRVLKNGCSLIRDEEICLSSKDGRKATTHNTGLSLENEPCVWCGGGNCDSSNNNLCEPFAYLMYGEGNDRSKSEFTTFHAKQVFKIATCQDGKPVPPSELKWGGTRPAWEAPEPPAERLLQCLNLRSDGCSAIKDMGNCMDSRDGRAEAEDADGLKIHGQPCVWCGGVACIGNRTSLCEPFDFVMNGEGKAFDHFNAKASFTVATCEDPPDKLPTAMQTEELTCLKPAEKGCPSLTSEASCVASRDARNVSTFAGLKIEGQACVWCGGAPCTSAGDSKCDAYDYAVNGQRRAFMTSFRAPAWKVGTCPDGEPSVERLPTTPPPTVAWEMKTKWEERMEEDSKVVAQPFAQCGGSGWQGATACGPGHVCKEMSETFWQCIPGAGSAPKIDTSGIPADGRFVTEDHKIYWQDPWRAEKHLVRSRADCDACGCGGNIWVMPRTTIDQMALGADFTCAMKEQNKAAPQEVKTPFNTAENTGRFITAGRHVWWESPEKSTKHLVPPGAGCEKCGCAGDTELVKESVIDALQEAEPFDCGMLERQVTDGRVRGSMLAGGGANLGGASLGSELGWAGFWLVVAAASCGAMHYLGAFELGKRTRAVCLSEDSGSEQDGIGDPEEGFDKEADVPLVRAAEPPEAYAFHAARVSAPGGVALQAAAPAGATLLAAPNASVQYRSVTFAGPDAQAKAQAFMTPQEPLSWENRAPPTAAPASAPGPRSIFDQIDADGDGQITREEWQRYAFNAFDQNRDGVISPEEWVSARNPGAAASSSTRP